MDDKLEQSAFEHQYCFTDIGKALETLDSKIGIENPLVSDSIYETWTCDTDYFADIITSKLNISYKPTNKESINLHAHVQIKVDPKSKPEDQIMGVRLDKQLVRSEKVVFDCDLIRGG